MTRRQFFSQSLGAAVAWAATPPLIVPVQILIDKRLYDDPGLLRKFWGRLWPEAFRDLASCDIRLQNTTRTVEVWRPDFRQPVVPGVEPRQINLAVTDRIPMEWDGGRALSGVTTLYRGCPLCMVALDRAHGNQVPFLSLNTCLHELLHALLQDVFEPRPPGLPGQVREARVDWYGTRLWLFGDGAVVHRSAGAFLRRVQGR